MATPKRFLQSLKNDKLKFEIMDYNPVTQTATLQGVYGRFTMAPFTKEKVTADGYKLIEERVGQ